MVCSLLSFAIIKDMQSVACSCWKQEIQAAMGLAAAKGGSHADQVVAAAGQ